MKKLFLGNQEYIRLEKSFKEWLGILGYAETTVYNLPNLLREFLHYLEQKDIAYIAHVSPEIIQSYFNYLYHRLNDRREGVLGVSSLNKHIQSLKKFSEYIHQSQNILLPIAINRLVREVEEVTVLSKEEISLLYESARGDDFLKWRDWAMLSVYYSCGLRRREGVKLDVSDVDLVKNRLHVRYGKGNKERIIPFTEGTSNYLKSYLKEFRSKVVIEEEKGFLLSIRGNRISGQSLLVRLKVLQKRTEKESLIEKQIGLHSLRHSIATHLLENEMPLETIQQFLGHSSLESTQIYTHLSHNKTKPKL